MELKNIFYFVLFINLLINCLIDWLNYFHSVCRQEMIQRAEGRKADQTAHAQLVQSNYDESLVRHEYAAQHPAYADGRVWWAAAEGLITEDKKPFKILVDPNW